jgi:hypothetical protein
MFVLRGPARNLDTMRLIATCDDGTAHSSSLRYADAQCPN